MGGFLAEIKNHASCRIEILALLQLDLILVSVVARVVMKQVFVHECAGEKSAKRLPFF